ncbi:MAG: hypothetical protein JSW58_07605 [Candidatus Latescibacterota bacterium]|nr:MAG: hypothetical protein JSW58_07605 [Candidatus Latescibacterota bacterium]
MSDLALPNPLGKDWLSVTGFWRNRITLIATLIILMGGTGTQALGIDGYYKNFFVVDHLPEITNLPRDEQQLWIGSVSQRLRVNAFQRLTGLLSVNVSYALVARVQDPAFFDEEPTLFGETSLIGFIDAAGYRVADLDTTLFPRDPKDIRSFAMFQNLDRLFVTVSVDWFDLYVGRQAIAWGSARVINPTDVIAPFLYTELDTEDRIGVDAARIRVPLGALSEFDAGYVAGEDLEFSESAFFLRGKAYAAKTDLAGLVVGFREHLMIGADVARAIGGASSWLETAYVFAHALGGTRSSNDDDYLRFSVGCDYSFPRNIYAYIEYHFNQAGTDRTGDYWRVVQTPAYLDGSVYLLGEHYLAPGASIQITPLVTLTAQALVNITDPSSLFVPVVEYNIKEDVYLQFGAYLATGKSPEIPVLKSEFGTYPDMIYASFRIYF